jgi:hypothetical protein
MNVKEDLEKSRDFVNGYIGSKWHASKDTQLSDEVTGIDGH